MRVSILGATGSIGQTTLSIFRSHPGRFRCAALTAQTNVEKLAAMAREFLPDLTVIGDASCFPALKEALAGTGLKLAAGDTGLEEAATLPADMVMSAIVGVAGLKPTLAAIRQGTTIALANKETLVAGGEFILNECKKHNATLIPVDSEHHAIFQLLGAHTKPATIEKITLTASGGPFREWTAEALESVTPAQAVKHPNWSMGAKISVDSATMMNKGLELIEAHYLFGLPRAQLDVVIHPESIIHGLVHFCDGSVFAHMSLPDMATPIAGALCWPERLPLPIPKLELAQLGSMRFFAPDTLRFRCLKLALDAMEAGGSATITLNAANEVAVEAFLAGRIGFMDIPKLVGRALEEFPAKIPASLEEVLEMDYIVRNKYASPC